MTNCNRSIPLSSNTVAEIQSLAKQISVAEHLDAEIQAELRGHIEDKLRGYLSGEVRVSEGDAVILAKAHFGDARVVKGMFQGVHVEAHGVLLGRRLIAVFAASLIVSVVMAAVDVLWTVSIIYPAATAATERHVEFSRVPYIFFAVFAVVLKITLLWAILMDWRRRQKQGMRIWFACGSPFGVAVIVSGMLLGLAAIAYFRVSEFDSIYHSEAIVRSYLKFAPFPEYSTVVMGWVLACISYGLQAVLWIWWSDSAPRTRRSLIYALVCWIAATQVNVFIFDSVGYLAEQYTVNIRVIEDFFSAIQRSVLLHGEVEAMVGLLALILYMSATRRQSTVMVA